MDYSTKIQLTSRNVYNKYKAGFEQIIDRKIKLRQGESLITTNFIGNSIYLNEGILSTRLLMSSGEYVYLEFFGNDSFIPTEDGELFPVLAQTEFIALTDCTVWLISNTKLLDCFCGNKEFLKELMGSYDARLESFYYSFSTNSKCSAKTRICDFLYIYFYELQEYGNAKSFELSQVLLKDILGISHAQLEREIKMLKDEGIISTGHKNITVISQDKLVQYCSAFLK